jgi:DNA-binding XRE family transcriptional regulator
MSTQPGAGAVPAWTLSDRLRKAREFAGLKQAELADEIGIARSSVVNYEAGRYAPSRPVALSWAIRCGVDYGWLTGDPDRRVALAAIGRGVKNSVSRPPAFALAS